MTTTSSVFPDMLHDLAETLRSEGSHADAERLEQHMTPDMLSAIIRQAIGNVASRHLAELHLEIRRLVLEQLA